MKRKGTEKRGGVQIRDKQDSLKIAWEAEHDKTT